ncbi:MAG TPA: gamma-glutamyl-gamma-aminobutyrate hydrolase family protein [Gemmatimonadaceae bacterium]|nr:gamma-glutamyl-gamma-aminobutyrate hydrolase family protein [Gemmatimonadaceae bacterium]
MAPPLVAITSSTRMHGEIERVRLNQAYVHAVEQAGLLPLVAPPLADARLARAILSGVDGLVLSGGEDVSPHHYGAPPRERTDHAHDRRDLWEIALVAEARRRAIPTFAICRGLQVANVALGGSLVQDLPSEWEGAIVHDAPGRASRVHEVRIEGGSYLAEVIGRPCVRANSLHHQAIATLAPGLRVTARAPDGVIEAVEWTGAEWWMLGVQWHPEELVGTPEPWDRALFAAFADACAAARRRRGGPPNG